MFHICTALNKILDRDNDLDIRCKDSKLISFVIFYQIYNSKISNFSHRYHSTGVYCYDLSVIKIKKPAVKLTCHVMPL